MTLRLDRHRSPRDLLPKIARVFELSAAKIRSIEDSWRPEDGAPVFTVEGRYHARGWTEWTQGFQFGSALLQFDATGEASFLELGRARTVERMAPHLTHVGVHDHGFNNVSTYGNLWRLDRERRIEASAWERRFYELALKASGAVQARRWTKLPGGGFIHSFNGAHSLFVDTIRSLRALALGERLGQPLMEEQDEKISLLERLVQHARATATYNVYFGRGTRSIRRSRTCRAREPVQRRKRNLSRTEHAAGLLAVHDLDARARLGHVGFRGADRIPRNGRGRGARSLRRAGGRGCASRRRRARDLRSLHGCRRRRRRPVLGCGRAGSLTARWLARQAGRSFQRCRASGQLRRGHRRAKDCCAWVTC